MKKLSIAHFVGFLSIIFLQSCADDQTITAVELPRETSDEARATDICTRVVGHELPDDDEIYAEALRFVKAGDLKSAVHACQRHKWRGEQIVKWASQYMDMTNTNSISVSDPVAAIVYYVVKKLGFHKAFYGYGTPVFQRPDMTFARVREYNNRENQGNPLSLLDLQMLPDQQWRERQANNNNPEILRTLPAIDGNHYMGSDYNDNNANIPARNGTEAGTQRRMYAVAFGTIWRKTLTDVSISTTRFDVATQIDQILNLATAPKCSACHGLFNGAFDCVRWANNRGTVSPSCNRADPLNDKINGSNINRPEKFQNTLASVAVPGRPWDTTYYNTDWFGKWGWKGERVGQGATSFIKAMTDADQFDIAVVETVSSVICPNGQLTESRIKQLATQFRQGGGIVDELEVALLTDDGACTGY